MARSSRSFDFAPAGFFAWRTPLLPVEELAAWNDGLEAPAAEPEALDDALAADRRRLRGRLERLIERPEIREALFVASPSLVDGLDVWRAAPDGKKGRRAEGALVRYFQRMATRPTPFGLFAGCSLGTVDDVSRLRLEPRAAYRRHTRLDMDYLFALAEELGRDPRLRRRLRFRPNTSLYLVAGRWRYAEARLDGRRRSHHLVAVDTADYLEQTLELARGGATLTELAQALVDGDPDGEVTFEEAEEFVFELLDSQLLISDVTPLVTGPEPIRDLIEQLDVHPEFRSVAKRLAKAGDVLAELDRRGLGRDPERYREVAGQLGELPADVELPRLFQVDMIKPAARATLGGAVIAELERAVDVLWRVAGEARDDALSRFRTAFRERYEEGQAVPLVEALDEEIGIGFDRAGSADASPLLEGIVFPPPDDPSVPWSLWTNRLLTRLESARAAGAGEIELTDKDLAELGRDDLPPLADCFHVLVEVAAASGEEVDAGRFQLLFRHASGPSGAHLLGRFCHADPDLRDRVEGLLRAEEALRPEAVFAEIVHLPEGRIGNILSRPVMRQYEIPFLGRGGAGAEHRLPVTDLLVAVTGERIVLHSRRLGQPVEPRLTSAHNFTARGLGLYRFLCMLQSRQRRAGLRWDWGALAGCVYLPRVTYGRTVLARARWRVTKDEIEQIEKTGGKSAAGLFRAWRRWRRERGLPRRALLIDADNELLVDFGNVLSLDAFRSLIKNRPIFELEECFPADDRLWTTGPEGRFACELVVPFVRREETAETVDERATLPPIRHAGRRTFPPGSAWLYAKLYTGTSTADRLLVETLGPLLRRSLTSGAVDRWFFVRYRDAHWHLRLRCHGEPERLHHEVLPALQTALAPLLEDGRMWRFQLDTYQREVERYGGTEGIRLVELLSWADSEAVLTILEQLEGDEGADLRWRLALRGMDQLVRDFRLKDVDRLRLLEGLQKNFAREHRVDGGVRKQLADRLRRERRDLEQLLEARYREDHPLAPGLAAFERRSAHLQPIIAELRRHREASRLSVPLVTLAASGLHMFANRLLRSDIRAHETVLYDFLYRLALSRQARTRGEKPRQGKSGKG